MSNYPVPLVVTPRDIPPQKSVATAVILTICFGPLGLMYVNAKSGLLALLACIGLAIVTLGLSVLLQVFVLPFMAASMAQKSNAYRAELLAATGWSA